VAKKHNKKKPNYDEGFVRGKRALLIGIFPIFIFLGTVVLGTWLLTEYYNKVTVNQDDSDVCKLVRKHYPATIKADYPCDIAEKEGFWLVTFSQNTGTSSIPSFISFKVDKNTKDITSAIDLK
jgi:hypothetical protein